MRMRVGFQLHTWSRLLDAEIDMRLWETFLRADPPYALEVIIRRLVWLVLWLTSFFADAHFPHMSNGRSSSVASLTFLTPDLNNLAIERPRYRAWWCCRQIEQSCLDSRAIVSLEIEISTYIACVDQHVMLAIVHVGRSGNCNVHGSYYLWPSSFSGLALLKMFTIMDSRSLTHSGRFGYIFLKFGSAWEGDHLIMMLRK